MAESNQNEELTKAANRLLHYFEGVWEETGASLDQKDIERILREELGKEAPMPSQQPGEETGLLPCPFCGKPGRTWETADHELYFAGCSNEKIKLSDGGCMMKPVCPPRQTKGAAIAAWNRRTLPVSLGSSPSVTSVEAKASASNMRTCTHHTSQERADAFGFDNGKDCPVCTKFVRGSIPAVSAPAADIGMVIAEKLKEWINTDFSSAKIAQIANEVINSSLPIVETIQKIKMKLQIAKIASCTCLTKTNDPIYHAPSCSYRTLLEIEELVSSLPAPAMKEKEDSANAGTPMPQGQQPVVGERQPAL